MSPTIHKLNTGASIPAIGFGTWQDKEEQEGAVIEALKVGVSDTYYHSYRIEQGQILTFI